MRSLVRVQDGPLSYSSYGGIAQLVERLLCKQDVSGSSPLTSTNATESSLITESSEVTVKKSASRDVLVRVVDHLGDTS